MPAQLEERVEEQLVALRRDVLNDVEHAVGNLLQRMHHAARSAKASLGVQGERLETTLDDLERLLELFFDYVSPVDVQVRPSEAGRIAESLAAQLRAQGISDVKLSAVPSVAVLADPRVLSRSFLLLAQSCMRQCDGAALTIETAHDAAGDRVEFVVRAAAEPTGTPTAQSSLAAAVAGRLIELQGGELRTTPHAACLCAIMLPAAGDVTA